MLCFAFPVLPAAVVSDHNVYAVPQAPQLPAAGETFVDATFGSTLLRVTDERDGANCFHAYSTWPSFNKDSTILFLGCDDKVMMYQLDPVQFKILRKRPLFNNPTPAGEWAAWQDAVWSGLDPNILYTREGSRIWAYNVRKRNFHLVKDFRQEFGDARLISRMTVTPDDNTFAFTRGGLDFRAVGFAVWRRDVDKIVARETKPDYYKVQIDKSGRYLLNILQAQGAGLVQAQILDLQTETTADLTDDWPDFAPGHGDLGHGVVIAHENWRNRILRRNMDTPHEWSVVLDQEDDWTQESHYSLLADDESWLVVSNASHSRVGPGKFRDEILQLSTDGRAEVRRLAHHHSKYSDYYDSPRANVSRDGRFIVFTSNWGSKRRDVFVLQLPPLEVRMEVTPEQSAGSNAESVLFKAKLEGAGNQKVRWSIDPPVGVISPGGLYTAPAALTSRQTVRVTATSVTDPRKSASATLALEPSERPPN